MATAEDIDPTSDTQPQPATAEQGEALRELKERLAHLRREFKDLNQRDIASP